MGRETLDFCKFEKNGALTVDFCKFCQEHPQFFANGNIQLPKAAKKSIEAFVKNVDSIKKSPEFLEKIGFPKNDSPNHRTDGVLMGFDFHLVENAAPQLIEINTNAGGAFLNVALLAKNGKNLDSAYLAQCLRLMFSKEWRLFSGAENDDDFKDHLREMVIVDESPKSQFLYPEFKVAQAVCEEAGWDCEIADPSEFTIQNNALILKGKKVKFVYNRLTDFYLKDPKNAVLKRAFEENLACISPNPAHYQRLAKKDHLMILREFDSLKNMIPMMEKVDSEEFWNRRKSLFFKPAEGFGSRAVYKGEKLTKKVFAEILEGNYLAQSLVAPSIHEILVNGEKLQMKADIRAYAYQNEVLHFAARLYVGQTTNFRTRGGGFALCV